MDFNLILAQAGSTGIDANTFGDLAPPLQIALFLGAMSFATAALVSLTAFTRIIIVLSFVRRALSTQEIPPNQVILGSVDVHDHFRDGSDAGHDQRKRRPAVPGRPKNGRAGRRFDRCACMWPKTNSMRSCFLTPGINDLATVR